MAAVRALALKAVGQARKNHGHIGGFGGGHGPQKLSLVPLVAVCGLAMDAVIGQSGLEAAYDDLLRGQDGRVLINTGFDGAVRRTA